VRPYKDVEKDIWISEREEGWRKFYNQYLLDSCNSLNNIRGTKSKRMRWAGKVVHMGDNGNTYRVLMGKS
jgi:hypothetical protein